MVEDVLVCGATAQKIRNAMEVHSSSGGDEGKENGVRVGHCLSHPAAPVTGTITSKQCWHTKDEHPLREFAGGVDGGLQEGAGEGK